MAGFLACSSLSAFPFKTVAYLDKDLMEVTAAGTVPDSQARAFPCSISEMQINQEEAKKYGIRKKVINK